MTDVIQLSHSTMELFQGCARRYQFAKLDRAPQAPSEALAFGDAVHQAIEADGRAAVAGERRLGIPQLVSVFSRALSERLVADDPLQLLAERVAGMRVRGLAILRAYQEQFAPGYRPTAVEAPFPVVELPALHTGAPSVRFTGRIDALCGEHGETIVDFKTGKPWQPGVEHQKPQASAYLWALRQAGAQVARVKFVVLSTLETTDDRYDAQVDIRVTARSARQLDGYAAQVETTAAAIARATARNEFPPNPGPLCGWCSFCGVCASGQRWLRGHDRAPAVPLVDLKGQPLAWRGGDVQEVGR